MSVLNETEMIIKESKVDGNRANYTVALVHNGKAEIFEYHCSKDYIVYKEEVVQSLLSDMDAYIVSEGVLDFAMIFGYPTSTFEACKEARRVYRACESETRQMRALFTEDEIAELYEELFNE